ncbi:MAG: DUF2116 family Zn-ribbon domain-containing protein [Candidatus Thermoplasmatota archaeon]|nr:DUF2116 family Zn-ribbon domain-containing protein [Candidatus Thermoplasmatota archaeon]
MDRVPQHAHCQICGKAVPYGEIVCSDACREKYDSIVKKRKMYMYFMYIALALLIVMFVLVYIP